MLEIITSIIWLFVSNDDDKGGRSIRVIMG